MVKLLLQAGADATLLPKPDEPPKPVVIQGSIESHEGCASFTTREFQVDLPAHDNKTAFLVGLPLAAVGGREFLESHSPHTRFMFEVNGLQIP